MLNEPKPNILLFEEIVLEYDVNYKDRKKYNSLIQSIPHNWFIDKHMVGGDITDVLKNNLVLARKVPEYTYNIMITKPSCDKPKEFWGNVFDTTFSDDDLALIHTRNFKCTVDTRLRSFYFKFFHGVIAFNNFLFKIGRKDSPYCFLCKKVPETSVHIFANVNV